MKRLLALMTAMCCGLSLPLFDRPKIVQAQTPRTDTIYFMGATRGKNYNNTGVLSWCVSQGWHLSYRNGAVVGPGMHLMRWHNKRQPRMGRPHGTRMCGGRVVIATRPIHRR